VIIPKTLQIETCTFNLQGVALKKLSLARMLAPKILLLIGPGETVETVTSARSPSPRLKPSAIFSIGSIGVEKCCSCVNAELVKEFKG
jgi:hypothetical protein